MNDLTMRDYLENERLREDLEHAARRERALRMKRFLEQSGKALHGEKRRRPAAPCAAC